MAFRVTPSYSCSSSSSSNPVPSPLEREDVVMEEYPPNSPEIISRSCPPSTFLTPNTKGVLICPLDRTPDKRFQFNGFREVKSALTYLQKENKTRGIEDREIAKLKELIISKNIEDPKEMLILLKLLSEHFFFGVEEIFHECLKSLRGRFPQMGEYMCTIPDADLSGPVLTPEGVKKMLNFYEQYCQVPKGMLSCAPLSALIPLLNEMEEEYREGHIQEKSMQGWAVYNDDFDEDKHFSPVFAICQDGKVHVFVFDSQGHEFHPGLAPRICQSFRKLLGMFGRQNIELYSYKEKRQSGQVECSIYTVLDLKNLVEMHTGNSGATIVDFYRQNPGYCSTIENPKQFKIQNPSPHEITQLSPAMMKPTQSLSRLRRKDVAEGVLLCSPYRVKRRLFGGKEVEKEQNPKTFQEEINAYALYSRNEEKSVAQNSYIAQRRLEYFVYLLTSILDPEEANETSRSGCPSREPLWDAKFV